MNSAVDCQNNTVAESFFTTIKSAIHTGGVSPAKFEGAYYSELKTI